MSKSALTELQQKIGYTFKDFGLLQLAVTHPSYTQNIPGDNYQRLEFLGDAVLEFLISSKLYNILSSEPEGRMTRKRADLVCESTLARLSQKYDLGRYIRLSKGEDLLGGRRKPSILSDVMEALIAAVYLDGGIDAARAFVDNIFKDESFKISKGSLDNKSKLQYMLQQEGKNPPVYKLEERSGPPHNPVFVYSVFDGDTYLGRGAGKSKHLAQQEAAGQALLNRKK